MSRPVTCRPRVAPLLAIGACLIAAACSPTTSGSSHLSGYAPTGPAADPIFTKQTSKVQTTCLEPELKQILADLKEELGATPIVTSGHRSGPGTRKGSYHRTCEAVDIQVPGKTPKQVAAAARAHPAIGGIGTYCHTRSVHIDIGPSRGRRWNC
ncbi:YcbK family protein [Lutibaculum baratangense]|uniref:Putative LIPOPROTEIN n=1 Tax=Lutibaculum baratangense AMV1 TaxID=631454 RepID=V4TGN9_9HYPH|nr:D-Ala-D-Ala carboxypeptidase family metallohydrolase [Lutibaculum baratangense]ESR25263.1 putative LIPOPROTEIN [Lutibaculum baratangense AMV1]